MKEETYNDLMVKLSKALGGNEKIPFVSPKSKSSGDDRGSMSSEALLITSKLKVDEMGSNTKFLVHTLLHKLYGSGSKDITRPEIVELHTEIKNNMNHHMFDRLDYE